MTRVRIIVGDEVLEGQIDDTPAGRAVAEILPLETPFSTWGDEFTFSIPMQPLPLEAGGHVEMDVGDIAYWPEGNALAIFFGTTPASTGPRPVASSPVNRVGRILRDAHRLGNAAAAATIRIELA